MDPTQLPLEPLIAPNPVSIWPLAPIWWIGAVFLVLLLIFCFWLLKKIKVNHHLHKIRKKAKMLVLAQQKPYQKPTEEWLQLLNRYLKQVALNDYPNRSEVRLNGDKWLDFLVATAPTADRAALQTLIHGQYQSDFYLNDKEIDAIQHSVLTWIGSHHV